MSQYLVEKFENPHNAADTLPHPLGGRLAFPRPSRRHGHPGRVHDRGDQTTTTASRARPSGSCATPPAASRSTTAWTTSRRGTTPTPITSFSSSSWRRRAADMPTRTGNRGRSPALGAHERANSRRSSGFLKAAAVRHARKTGSSEVGEPVGNGAGGRPEPVERDPRWPLALLRDRYNDRSCPRTRPTPFCWDFSEDGVRRIPATSTGGGRVRSGHRRDAGRGTRDGRRSTGLTAGPTSPAAPSPRGTSSPHSAGTPGCALPSRPWTSHRHER